MPSITLSDVRNQGFSNPPYSDDRVNEAISEAEDYVLQVTGNWFDVRELTIKLDGSGCEVLPLPHPIVSISEIKVYDFVYPLESFKVYNRHLQGYLDPDDRQDPKIEIIQDSLSGYYERSQRNGAFFPEGSQNVEITGKFGYRDYDPGDAEGKVPPMLKRALYMLLQRFLEDAASPYAMGAWRAHELSRKVTRGQTCENSSAITQGKIFGGLTGDVYVDRILSLFCRPIGAAVV